MSKATHNVVDPFGNQINLDESGLTILNAKGQGFRINPDGTVTLFGGFTFPSSVSGVISWDGRIGAVTPQTGDYAYNQISGTPTLPVFVDAEVPTTFNTNTEYVLANVPNPVASLLLFVNGVLLVAGTDYTFNSGTKHIIFTGTIVVNTIVAWYRH